MSWRQLRILTGSGKDNLFLTPELEIIRTFWMSSSPFGSAQEFKTAAVTFLGAHFGKRFLSGFELQSRSIRQWESGDGLHLTAEGHGESKDQGRVWIYSHLIASGARMLVGEALLRKTDKIEMYDEMRGILNSFYGK